MSVVDEKVIQWLLEEDNPSVRYWTLIDILGRSPSGKEVQEAQEHIMESSCVRKMLKGLHPDGYWGKIDDFYNPKYSATTHNMLILAEFGAKRTIEIEKVIEHMFLFQRNSGHFLIEMPKTDKGYDSVVKDGCCYDGNILYYLIHFGFLDDPRTQRLITFQEDYYSSEEGGWKCRAFPIDASKVFPTNCYMGRVKMLRALSMIPKTKQSKKIQRIIDAEIEVILENQVFKYLRNPDGSRKEKAGWKRFGFPLFYQSDVLEVLDTLTRLGVKDERMQESINLILQSREPDGRWILKNTFNGKMLCEIEKKGQASKWITLRAARVLTRYETH